VFFKIRITSLSLDGRGLGRGCKFDNLNISPPLKSPPTRGGDYIYE